MTRKEWLDRLDEMVAEHVFGWTWWTWTDPEGQTAWLHETMEDPDPMKGMREDIRENHPDVDPPAETTRYTEGIAKGAEIARPMWCGGEYSRSISDAWKLVEAMEADGWTWLANHTPDMPKPYMFVFAKKGGAANVRAATPALSATLAALRVVGCEIPEEPTDAE